MLPLPSLHPHVATSSSHVATLPLPRASSPHLHDVALPPWKGRRRWLSIMERVVGEDGTVRSEEHLDPTRISRIWPERSAWLPLHTPASSSSTTAPLDLDQATSHARLVAGTFDGRKFRPATYSWRPVRCPPPNLPSCSTSAATPKGERRARLEAMLLSI